RRNGRRPPPLAVCQHHLLIQHSNTTRPGLAPAWLRLHRADALMKTRMYAVCKSLAFRLESPLESGTSSYNKDHHASLARHPAPMALDQLCALPGGHAAVCGNRNHVEPRSADRSQPEDRRAAGDVA